MNCFEAQNLSMQYVNGELSGAKLEGFLEHINRCSDCKEELEICYTIVNGMKELEDEKVQINDFHTAFENMLEKSLKKIEKNTKFFIRKIIILDILLFAPMFFASGDSCESEQPLKYIYNNKTESSFKINIFDRGYVNTLDDYITLNKEYIDNYINE